MFLLCHILPNSDAVKSWFLTFHYRNLLTGCRPSQYLRISLNSQSKRFISGEWGCESSAHFALTNLLATMFFSPRTALASHHFQHRCQKSCTRMKVSKFSECSVKLLMEKVKLNVLLPLTINLTVWYKP